MCRKNGLSREFRVDSIEEVTQLQIVVIVILLKNPLYTKIRDEENHQLGADRALERL
jgi:hypothetical protein